MELETVSLLAVLCVLISLIPCAVGTDDESGDCEFIYTQQPAPTNLSCSPDPVLELVCEARSNGSQEQRFRLLWFAMTIGKEPMLLTDHVTGVKVSSTSGKLRQVTSTLSLTLQVLTLQMQGTMQLFCQIELHDGILLQPSQHLSLHSQHSTLCSPPILVDTTHTCVGGPPIALDQAGATPTSASPTGAAVPVALYSVVGVIMLFIVVIITLSVIVVVLYRKRMGHMEISSPVDHGSGMDSYDADRSPVKIEEDTKHQLTSGSSLHPTNTPPPPRPPKPGDHNTPHSAEPNITSSSNRHKKKLKFKVLDSRNLGGYECSPTYQCSSTVTPTDDHPTDKYQCSSTVTPTHDHPTDKYQCSSTVTPTDDHPTDKYQCSSTVTPTHDHPTDKYSGDYERDPNYRRHFPAKQLLNFNPLVPHRIPPPDEVLDGRGGVVHPVVEAGLGRRDSRTDKYRGDYERCQTYVLPPHCAQSVRCMDDPADLPVKYRGDYERNPVYMERLLQNAAAHQDTARQDIARDVLSPDVLCPEDTQCSDTAGHGYTTLAITTRQTAQPYTATLTHIPPNTSEHPLFPYDLPS